jgi:hypothetical protein
MFVPLLPFSAILACVNPKALWFDYPLDPKVLQVRVARVMYVRVKYAPVCCVWQAASSRKARSLDVPVSKVTVTWYQYKLAAQPGIHAGTLPAPIWPHCSRW